MISVWSNLLKEKMVSTEEKIKRNIRSERNRHTNNEEETKQKLQLVRVPIHTCRERSFFYTQHAEKDLQFIIKMLQDKK